MLTDLERFYELTEFREGPLLTPCRIWTGQTYSDSDYGKFHLYAPPKIVRAHRWIWIKANGEPPEDKPFILHHCDNPPCTELEHLYAGDAADNQRDCVERNRNPNKLKEFCARGHEFSDQNTRIVATTGQRKCRQCEAERAKERRDAHRADNPLPDPKQCCKQGHPYSEANTGRDKTGARYCKECKRVSARTAMAHLRILQMASWEWLNFSLVRSLSVEKLMLLSHRRV